MITEQEIESFAVQIADPDFDGTKANIDALIGHLDSRDYDAVLWRASRLARQRGAAYYAEANELKTLTRLAHATGMPPGGKPILWLRDRGLVEQVDGSWRAKKPTPRAVT